MSVKVHSLALFALPRTCDVTPKCPSWPATLQPLALVVSPRLRLRQFTPFMAWKGFFQHLERLPMDDYHEFRHGHEIQIEEWWPY